MKRQLASVGVAVLLLLAAASGGVVAQEDDEEDSLFEQFTGVETNSNEDSSWLDGLGATVSAASNWGDRAMYGIESMLSDQTDAERAQQYATNTTAVFNSHNETLVNYTNTRVGVTPGDWDTIEVQFTAGDATATRYIVAENASGNFTSAAMVNQTNRSVDKTMSIENSAAKSAPDELEYFATEYAAEDRNVDMALLSRMQAYADNIDLPEGVR